MGQEIAELSKIEQYIQSKLPDIANFGLKLLLALIAYWICSKLIRWVCKLFRIFLEKKSADPSANRFLTSALKGALYFLLIMTIAVQMGIKEASVVAVIGSAGVGIGLALQGGMANLAGGVLILLLKPFQLGDYIISSQKEEGTVKRIDMFYTTLNTVDNRTIVIPNAQLTNSSIINVTAQDRRQLEILVGISYESDIKKAKEIMDQLLLEQPDVNNDETKSIFVSELAASSVIIGCRAWVPTDRYWPVKWDLNEKIKLAFDQAGIKIPYPQVEVHMGK